MTAEADAVMVDAGVSRATWYRHHTRLKEESHHAR